MSTSTSLERNVIRRFLTNYVERHLHPVNRLLHLVGVPLTFVVSIVMLVQDRPWWALACFVTGYGLQFIGHAIEGNDAGETVLVKRWLGRPYEEFGSRHPSRAGRGSQAHWQE